ncbi:MAG: hypothetical protein GY847_18665 [Proteobacteria bacterium]|nr:hypothetical protein [Pseudomonadota bacterium]
MASCINNNKTKGNRADSGSDVDSDSDGDSDSGDDTGSQDTNCVGDGTIVDGVCCPRYFSRPLCLLEEIPFTGT